METSTDTQNVAQENKQPTHRQTLTHTLKTSEMEADTKNIATEHCISKKEPFIPANGPYIPEKSFYISAKEPCISAREPTHPQKTIIDLQKRPIYPMSHLYVRMNMYACVHVHHMHVLCLCVSVCVCAMYVYVYV